MCSFKPRNPINELQSRKKQTHLLPFLFSGNTDHFCDNSVNYREEHLGGCQWKSPDWKGGRWYRFTGAAGTKMPNQSPGRNRCGGDYPGWVRDGNPSIPGVETKDRVCFKERCKKSQKIRILNCGSYLLYKLPNTEDPVRYCGAP